MTVLEDIRVSSSDVSIEGVEEPIRELGFQSPISPEEALRYGQWAVDKLSTALIQKLGRAQLDPELIYDQGSLIRERLEKPQVMWGVTGVNRAAGTLAAMHAIRDKADTVGYSSDLTTLVEGQPLKRELIDYVDRVWFGLAITNPELQPKTHRINGVWVR